MGKPAKLCSCGESFSRNDLIQLKSLTPIGMMHLEGEDPDLTMFCFTHTRWSCRTTFGLPVEMFRDEIDEPIPERCLSGTPACGGHCNKLEDLELCEAECRSRLTAASCSSGWCRAAKARRRS